MSEAVTSLREAKNIVEIKGTLLEKNLELETYKNNGVESRRIKGNLIVGVDDDSRYKVNYYANELTTKGEQSKSFTGLMTVMEQYVSKAEALAKGLDESLISVVEILAKITMRDFVNDDGETISYPNIASSYVKRATSPITPCANFSLECYFENIENEVVDGVATGRAKIDAIVPIYGGKVFPLTLYTTDDSTYGDIGGYILENYSNGKSGAIDGVITCKVGTSTTNEGASFGKPAPKTFTTYSYEYTITGGQATQYLITDIKNFDKGAIKQAMLYRDEYLSSLTSKDNSESESSTGGFGSTAGTRVPTKELNF